MNRGLLVFLAMCAFAAAMVPKERAAVNTEGKEAAQVKSQSTPANVTEKVEVCAPQTPCSWTKYKTPAKIVEFTIVNTYCICDTHMTCTFDEDDTGAMAFVYRCRKTSEIEDS